MYGFISLYFALLYFGKNLIVCLLTFFCMDFVAWDAFEKMKLENKIFIAGGHFNLKMLLATKNK
jgi:hypothetical protein